MAIFTVPKWVKQHVFQYDSIDKIPVEVFAKISRQLEKFKVDNPENSIVIPAYNEESSLLNTLSSISQLDINCTEIIVVNNGSTDRTQEIIERTGVGHIWLKENQQVKGGRLAGLKAAKGKYILQADADSIYPKNWGKDYVNALKDPQNMMAYGQHSFISYAGTSRIILSIHEFLGRKIYKIRSKNREFMNVHGFNSAFRKKDALEKGTYDHSPTGSEDGQMALTLMQYGQLKFISGNDSLAWTSDRRIQSDGGMAKAFFKRLKREGSRLIHYSKPSKDIGEVFEETKQYKK